MNPRYFIGSSIILIAVLLLLNTLNIIPVDIGDIFGSIWPLMIVLVGVNIISKGKRNSYFSGLVVILIGVLFFLKETRIFPWNFWELFWPLLLILIGANFIFGKNKNFTKRKEMFGNSFGSNSEEDNNADFVAFGSHKDTSNGDFLNINAVFGSTDKRINSTNFKGGKIVTVFGGVKLDLRDTLLEEVNEIEIVCVFGGVEIFVPNNWKIEASGNPIFGGFEDKTRLITYQNDEMNQISTLYIDFNVSFGGVVIRN